MSLRSRGAKKKKIFLSYQLVVSLLLVGLYVSTCASRMLNAHASPGCRLVVYTLKWAHFVDLYSHALTKDQKSG